MNMNSISFQISIILLIICGTGVFNSEGILCFNCVYKEKDPSTHSCLLPKNEEIVNCTRDGKVMSGNVTKDKSDKCSFVNGTHNLHGAVIFRTCSRGETMCKILKERNQVLLTNERRLITMFLLRANHCNCEGDRCNSQSPPKGTLPYKPRLFSELNGVIRTSTTVSTTIAIVSLCLNALMQFSF